MAGAEDRDAVLDFLLGSTPDLCAAPAATAPGSAAVEEDEEEPPELEPVSDSDAESDADAATAEAATDSDAVTSCESEGDQQAATSEGEAKEEEEPLDKGTSVSEAEHEDDCEAATSTESDEEEQHQVQRKAKEKQTELGGQRAATEVKAVKTAPTRRGIRPVAAVTKVMTSKKGLSVEKTSNLQQDACGGSVPTLEELLFVGCVATVLVAYLVACVYSFFHPLEVPLPSCEGLYSAYDISNVSVRIVNPPDNSQITPQGVWLEWELANFPADALQQYGAEVFRYRVSLDDEVITSDVGFLALDDGNEGINSVNSFNRTVLFPIPRRKFIHDDGSAMASKQFKLHLEVTVPIPGLIGELKTYKQEVYVLKPAAPSPEDGVQLQITSPLDGMTVEQGQSIVLEYTAVNVLRMEVLLNDNVYLKKTHVSDGNLLLRGLGVGSHKFEVRALNEQDEVAVSSVVHVEIVEHSMPGQDEE